MVSHPKLFIVLLEMEIQGRIQGAPIFGKANFILTLYTISEKIFLKLNFDFIVAEIRGVFGSVGVYACVRVYVSV